MRNATLLILLALVCSSCYVYRSYEQQQHSQLTALPLTKQEKELELFFAGENMPQQDYLRLGLLKEGRTSYNSNLGSLLDRMKAQAQEMGADAIIVMGTENTERVRTDGFDDTYSVPGENMWGIAIRYLDNLQFEQNVLSHLEVTGLHANTKSANGIIDLAPDGELESPIAERWGQYVYYHSMEYLVENKRDWQFTKVLVGTPENLYNIIRLQNVGSSTKAKVKVSYDREDKVTELKISYLGQRQINEKMVLVYDNQNRIVQRRWTELGGKKIVVDRSYTADGLIAREDYTIQRGEAGVEPLLRVDYRYFLEEELLQLLEKEQIVRVGS